MSARRPRPGSRRGASGAHPPRWAERLLQATLPAGLPRDALLGDLEEELREHAVRTSPAAARRRYARQAAGVALRYFLFRVTAPDPHTTGDRSMTRALLDDLRHALRSLAHVPGFTLLAVLTLGVGVGATTAIFSVVDGVLLRPLPYPDADRLMVFRYALDGREMDNHSEPELLDFERELSSFSAVAGWTPTSPTLGSTAQPERIAGVRATAALFPLLEVAPLLGRTYTAEEDRPGGDRVVVLSHGLWTRSFAADRDVVGRTIDLEGVPHTVVGVMPAGFSFPEPGVQAWVPFRIDRVEPWERNNHYLRVIGRLAPGTTLDRAREELAGLAGRSAAAYPQYYAETPEFRVYPMRDQVVGGVRVPLLLLMGAVIVVLLVASVNAAALFLARGESRRAEIAVRTALGAGRARVAVQLLGESLLVALGAALVGTAVAFAGVAGLRRLAPAVLPRMDQVAVDGRVLGLGLLVAVFTGLLFGLAPAVQAARSDVRDVLASGGRGGIGSRHAGRFRRGLVVAQLSLATMLTLGAGLLVRSFQELRRVDLGFDPKGVLAVPLAPSAAAVPADTPAVAFYRQLEARVAAIPGVSAVGSAARLPLADGHDDLSIQLEGQEAASVADAPVAGINWVTPGFFQAMGIALRRGRMLTEADRADAPPVALVNERLAAELWPGEDAVGKRVRMYQEGSPWMEIVGVVADVKHYSVQATPSTKLYLPHAQGYVAGYYSPNRMTVLVRTDGDPAALAPAVRAAVRETASAVPVGNVRPVRDVVGAALARERFTLLLLGAFAGVGLLLAAVGVYGVIARTVAARTREIGLRMAVGADRAAVAASVLREGLGLAALGCGLGLAGAAALSGVVRSLLFGISPLDPWTYLAAAALLALTAAVACTLPALRAARLDPVRALRAD